jgi:bifunctional non-homologous end joining protein LigD
VAKRLDSAYEPGRRSAAWRKMRLNRGQQFVIGGYTLGGKTFDALVFGYYEGDRLVCVGRTRSGFTPALRAQLWLRFRGLEIPECPFVEWKFEQGWVIRDEAARPVPRTGKPRHIYGLC